MNDEDSNLVMHAKRELDLIGMTEDSDDIDKLGREGVLEIVRMFASQGHSGGSAPWMIATIERLLRFEPLSELTNDPNEWMHVGKSMGDVDVWQSRRKPSAFSHDGGKTYYLVDERVPGDVNLEVTPVYPTEHKER